MFWLIGNRVIIPLKIYMKVTCSIVTWSIHKPASHSAGTPPPTPPPASKTERIKICIFLCLPLLSCQSCFTCCHPMLSFICVRRKDLTSSVYNVHLARQIFHTNFELGNETIFQQNEQHHFWTDLLWERGLQNFISLHDPEKSNTFF